MQRGLGGFPHERLHQDRCGRRFRTQNPNHERLHQELRNFGDASHTL
ncbi:MULTISPECIES: hypothetical protein [Moorena]|nr:MULTISPECIES: hypothetical protein [Moorena]NEQ18361.1 hypothetical protein [Moorena sp. SIO3E2]NER87287.1 hypothetical protein [Moorena sp. SIO3A2]